MKSENAYQTALIVFGVIATLFFGVFFLREIYPEYKLYQDAYVDLEKFRSSYTGKPVPPFKIGVKQILLPTDNTGPEQIDRCISCHVALKFSHFSPTKVAVDQEGKPRFGQDGKAILEPNEEYVWAKLDEKIKDLRRTNNQQDIAKADLAEAEYLESLKSVKVEDHLYDMTKVLQAHPLIGAETRPFEYHDIDEYGCTSCHSGNGRGLTTDKAHGPVYDGQYEESFTGPTPHFLEVDPHNDPPFSKVYNHKPGESIIFQTTPLLVGNLIEARCVLCHQPTPLSPHPSASKDLEENKKIGMINSLTETYRWGQSLYFSQACYACHRISPISRGGVGPELTLIGKNYPWYIKESIVWPQADLPTSTMPNMYIDHEELEALMTFLLAQRGENFSQSMMERKVSIKQWEDGKRTSWEQPIPPEDVKNLDYAMTVYATEGCASCHRLQGFTSSVGFAIEKNLNSQHPEGLIETKLWFRKNFPEEIPGSVIVDRIEKLGPELDKKIVDNVRKDQILEKIEKEHPKGLESFYSNFEFALRAKNYHYAQLAEKDPAHRADYEKQRADWQQKVRRVMKMFIQEYGLGRQVGPRLSWSGVYRSRQWLMEHFWNPSSHIARSIMPVFSFDESKFLSLTYMLQELGKRNTAQVQEMWEQNGFNSPLAYEMHCAQCHGNFRQGDGPVSHWIYPIPKNLSNNNFLHQLTMEQAIVSIAYGVNGTPMPPWNQTPWNETDEDQKGIKPVMTVDQISQLADWLYQQLPKGDIEDDDKIDKWEYSPEDVIKELNREKGKLKGAVLEVEKSKKFNQLAVDAKAQARAAHSKSMSPVFGAILLTLPPITKTDATNVDDIFDVTVDPVRGPPTKAYYIKKKYYILENIEAGKEFFLMNCAICHGNDADGSGARSVVMEDAKPRMLTNLDWLHTRDDLRLLRSIKFGVPGTSMTPWGDLTTTLQRLQLVIYIRSLTKEKDKEDTLKNALYKAFDEAKWRIEYFRTEQKKDNPHLAEITDLIDQESKIYANTGKAVIDALDDGESYHLFLKIIAFNDNRFTEEGKTLKISEDPGTKISAAIEIIKNELKKIILEKNVSLAAAEASLPSAERNKKVQDIKQQIKKYQTLDEKLTSLVKETQILRNKQKTLLNENDGEHHGK